jgi:hypothetical protein
MAAASASLAGYVAAAEYRVMGGTHKLDKVMLTASVFFMPMLAAIYFLNALAVVYHYTAALSIKTMCIAVFAWLSTFPLTFLGAILIDTKALTCEGGMPLGLGGLVSLYDIGYLPTDNDLNQLRPWRSAVYAATT